MRLWSIHPRYLDRIGLVALWREGLLAQKVLMGGTKGYRRHPQLERFSSRSDPVLSIGDYLSGVWDEAAKRGYRFDRSKISRAGGKDKITVTRGQLDYESRILRERLSTRDKDACNKLSYIEIVECHPIFKVVDGPIEEWERVKKSCESVKVVMFKEP